MGLTQYDKNNYFGCVILAMLRTKLHRPPVTNEHVYRDHLIDLLNKNLYKPVTLVRAGAGYGKSMLVNSWLEKSKIPYT